MRMKLASILVMVCLAVSPLMSQVQHLEQNWTEEDRQWFYTTPQGSKLIPYAWAVALERADSAELFVTGLERFGFLPNGAGNLPVGLVQDGQHLGMTCAACHTNQVAYRGTTWQIDGGPTNADLWEFLDDLGDSLRATTAGASSPKFRQFAQRVLGSGDTPANRAKLWRELNAFEDYYSGFIAASRPTTVWGKSRTDAFGMIFNRVTAIDLKVPANSRRPNQPVSYPFLWDTGWHNKVQWNGSAPNSFAIERLARNVGEVLGVFAEVELRKPTLLHWYYASTANRRNLLEIEDRLADLRSPKWPAALGAIDTVRAARGQTLYNQQCVSCHKIATPGRHQDIVMTPLTEVNTDPWMARVAHERMAQTGVLKGVKEYLIFGPRMTAQEAAGTITFNAVIGAILSPVTLSGSTTPSVAAASSTAPLPGADADRDDPDRARLRALLFTEPRRGDVASAPTDPSDTAPRAQLETMLKALGARHTTTRNTDASLAYKARPLDGIWATAPYLHNGSVPSLWDLLLPVAQRPKKFYVGNRELDPINVGFVSTPGEGLFLFDTSIHGNSNNGHEWGTTLSNEERRDLVEYLKSL
ncbi:MAG TPA: di-heme-cytochrome C peroxidase [Thermoanaerobaculia bacterium]